MAWQSLSHKRQLCFLLVWILPQSVGHFGYIAKVFDQDIQVLTSIHTGSKISEQECSSFTLWYKGVYALIALRVGEKGVDGYLKPRNAHYMHFIDCCPLYYQNTSLCRGENSIPTIKVTTKINQVFFFSIQKKFQQTEKTQKPQP